MQFLLYLSALVINQYLVLKRQVRNDGIRYCCCLQSSSFFPGHVDVAVSAELIKFELGDVIEWYSLEESLPPFSDDRLSKRVIRMSAKTLDRETERKKPSQRSALIGVK